jgi:peptide/nickel transport system substrate-binding protein
MARDGSRRQWRPTAALLLLALAAAACGGGSDGEESGDGESDGATAVVEVPQPSGEPVVGGELVYGIRSDGTGFDTTSPLQPASHVVIGPMNDPLVGIDENNNWKPNLAEGLAPNADFTEWTIKLRPDVRFHDGEPVDAAAVVANLEAFIGSPTVGFALSSVESVTAVDELTVSVKTSTPWATFPYYLADQPGYVVSPDTIGSNDTFVGVGPFVLENWNPGDSARMVRNDDYWRGDEGFPYLDAVTMKVIPEQEGRRQAFEAGDIQAYSNPGDSTIVEFLANPDVRVDRNTGSANEFLITLNTNEPPLDDVRVRQALAKAVDRDLIIESFRSGLTVPASSYIDAGSEFSVDAGYPGFDPEGAAELVAEYEEEVGPIEFTLLSANTTELLDTAALVVSLWEEVGIDVELEETAPGTVVPPVINDDFDAVVWAQFGGVDPDSEYVFFHSSGGALNWSNLESSKLDEGLDLGRNTDDPEVRAEGYAKVQEAFAEEVPMIWIDHLGPAQAVVSDPSVGGIFPGTLPDGSVKLGFVNGDRFSWEDVWIGG